MEPQGGHGDEWNVTGFVSATVFIENMLDLPGVKVEAASKVADGVLNADRGVFQT